MIGKLSTYEKDDLIESLFRAILYLRTSNRIGENNDVYCAQFLRSIVNKLSGELSFIPEEKKEDEENSKSWED